MSLSPTDYKNTVNPQIKSAYEAGVQDGRSKMLDEILRDWTKVHSKTFCPRCKTEKNLFICEDCYKQLLTKIDALETPSPET